MRRLGWLVSLSGCQLVFPLGPTTDATGPEDAPGPVAACSTRASSLVDPLRTSLEFGWTTFKSVDSGSLSAVPDQTGLVLTPGVDGQVGLYSLFSYDLDSSRFAVRLGVNTPAVGLNSVQFGLLEPAPRSAEAPGVARSYEWSLESGMLLATFFDGNGPGSVGGGLPYNPAIHQHLGFSRSQDTLRWEYSTDGTTFVAAFEQEMPMFRMVRPYMRDVREDPAAMPIIATFSDLNSQVTRADACPAAALRSTFDTDDPFTWQPLRVDGCKIEVAGAVTMTSDQAPNFTCQYASTGVYQLIGGSFDIALDRFEPTLDGEEQQVIIESIALARVTIRIYRENGTLKIGGLGQTDPEANAASLFDAAVDGERFFRFTGALDVMGKHKVTLFTSQDGVSFVKRGEYAGLEGFDRSRVILGGIGSATSTIAFDGVGTPP